MAMKPTINRYEQALALRFSSDAGECLTLRAYLGELLSCVWSQRESFSGKRPWGNSVWQRDVYKEMVLAKLLPGMVGADGYLETIDEDEARDFLLGCIAYMCREPGETMS